MKYLALALIFLVAVNARSYTSSDERFFKDWANRYNRNYENIEEYMKRFRNWLAAYDYVLEVNSKQNDFKLALNQFADMDNEEFKHYYTGYNFKERPVGGEVYLPTEGMPSSIDWTQKGAVTYVKNQGQCGSCWSFSTTGALEGLNYINNGILQPLSEQQLVDCSGSYGNMGCNGGLMDDAFEYSAAKGLETETDYPYTAQDGTCQYDSSKVVFSNTGHIDVPSDSVQQLEAAIAKGPVSVALDGGSYAFQLYSGGILSSDCGTQLDHGVLAVGYDQDSGFFKIKNSWGASWGESGYIRLTTNASNSEGECGLLAQPSYPTQ